MTAKGTTTNATNSEARGDLIATLLLVVGALAAVAGFGLLFSLWWQSGVQDDYEVLRLASQEFVNGRAIVAGELAETVVFDEPSGQRGGELPPESSSGQDESAATEPERDESLTAEDGEAADERNRWSSLRDFLVGVGRVVRARSEPELREQRRLIHEAIPFLLSAERQGFPAGRMAQGYRVLGESLFEVGRYDEAIEPLERAIQEDPSQRRDLLPILAESQLYALAPLAEQALSTIETFLADSTLLPKQRWAGELIHLRILIKLGRWDQVRDAIDRELQVKQGLDLDQETERSVYRDELRLLKSIAEVSRAIKRYGPYGSGDDPETADNQRALQELADAVERMHALQRESTPDLAAQARLWTARALLVQGKIEEALAQLMVVRQQRPFGAEAIVGALEEIELLARLGRGSELLQTTRYMMRELGDERGFDASLITFTEFQRRLIGAIEQLRLQGQYQSAIDAARSLPPVVDLVEALTQEGIGFREWADATLAAGTDLSGQVARTASLQSHTRYRAAGDAFARAAELQFNTPEYLSTQWSAIEAYQLGRHFERSLRLLQPYLRYETRGRLPRGLVAYGRALLAEDDPETAIAALTTCIVEHPRDPLRYDARLLAALAYAEKGDLENAKRLLQDNLQDGELTPQSPAWRDSLLTLGELLYQRGYRNHLEAQRSPQSEQLQRLRANQPILEEAIRRLDEAVERYWPIPRAAAAAYLAAKTRVMSAQLPQIESELPEILDAARRALRNQADQKLTVALDGFVRLRRHLARQEEDQRLPENEQFILRNCLLSEADVLRDMNRLEDASSAYRTVELRYMNEPPALEAIMGRVACAKQLGRDREADLLIRQAQVVLQRIPNEMDEQFAITTRYDRTGWEDYLGWMNQRITTQGA